MARTWTDEQLANAVASAANWRSVMREIGLDQRATSAGMVTVGRRPYSIRKDTPLVPYDPDVIDYFFIVDGDLNLYLIPSRVIAGRVALLLRTYKRFIVGNASGLLGTA
jgi:hypothetical protein